MPLSDEEARLLQQLEKSLAAEDPDFASTLRGSKLVARNRRLALLSGVGFLIGVGLLLAGAFTAMTWLGIVGFLVMLATAYIFVLAWRSGLGSSDDGTVERTGGPTRSSRPSSGSFVNRLEQRWQRRQDSDDL